MEAGKRIYWVVGALVFFCLFGNQGFRRMVAELSEMHRLKKSLISLRTEHVKLAHELDLIQKDPAYTEYLLRKLGYIKKGEVEYRFLPAGKRSQDVSD